MNADTPRNPMPALPTPWCIEHYGCPHGKPFPRMPTNHYSAAQMHAYAREYAASLAAPSPTLALREVPAAKEHEYDDPHEHNGWYSRGYVDGWNACREAMRVHDSDCALHNAPAMPAGPCDCALAQVQS